MIDLGMKADGQKELAKLMASTHRIAVTIAVLDMDFQSVSVVSEMFLDGQVSYDEGANVTRSMDLTLGDPLKRLHFDSNSPTDGALYADRQLSVTYGLINPATFRRFDIPVFTGPITGMDRTGAAVGLEAQGRDVLGMAPVWNRRTWKAGTPKTTIIRQILVQIMGEKVWRIDIPDKAASISRDLALGKDTLAPWLLARKLARSMGYELFYDGRGVARMVDLSSTPVMTFKSGRGGMVKTKPAVGYTTENLVNAVEVWGAKPKGKKRIHVRMAADRKHPLSPWKLGTDVQPRFLPAFYEDDSIKTTKDAKAFARRMLAIGLRQGVEVAFDSLPYPLGEPGDMLEVETPDYAGKFRPAKFTLPLNASGSSSIGYLKNVKPNRRAIRYRKAA